MDNGAEKGGGATEAARTAEAAEAAEAAETAEAVEAVGEANRFRKAFVHIPLFCLSSCE